MERSILTEAHVKSAIISDDYSGLKKKKITLNREQMNLIFWH